MKRLFLMVAITASVLSGCSLLSKESSVEKITPETLSSKLSGKESFVLVLGNERNCEPCSEYTKGTLNKSFKETGEKAYYLEIDNVKEQASMDVLISTLDNQLDIDVSEAIATPSTYFISKGEANQRSTGIMDYEKFISYKESANSIN